MPRIITTLRKIKRHTAITYIYVICMPIIVCKKLRLFLSAVRNPVTWFDGLETRIWLCACVGYTQLTGYFSICDGVSAILNILLIAHHYR